MQLISKCYTYDNNMNQDDTETTIPGLEYDSGTLWPITTLPMEKYRPVILNLGCRGFGPRVKRDFRRKRSQTNTYNMRYLCCKNISST